MPNKKITAMPSLGGNQVPTDLVTAVDLSAAPINQNVKSTLHDLFATITKNITDRAMRFQAPGSAPAVAAASQGALYHDGTAFLASSNGGAFEPLYTISAQSAALVFAGPASGPAATPTFRSLALTDLPSLATASLLGRISAGTGTPEQITSTAALLTWLQTPTSANLSTAVTDATGAGGALVFAFGPTLTNPRFNTIAADPSGSGSNILFTPTVGAVNHIEILNAVSGSGPTIRPTGLSANQPLNLASRGTGIISCVGNQLRVTGNTAAAAGILELRGGNASLSGGQIRLYEVTTNGTNYIGFQAPDSLASNLLFELPATDGTAGQVLSTDGAGILSWATRGTVTSVGLSAPSIFTVANSPVTGSGTLGLSLAPQGQNTIFGGPITGGSGTPFFRFLQTADLPQLATSTILGRASAGFGTTESVAVGAGIWTWLQSATADNLRSAVVGDTGTGDLVFANAPTITSPTVSSGNLDFTGAGRRITGDGTSAGTAVFDRLGFMSQTANSNSVFICVPNGSGSISGLLFFDRGNDTSNFAQGQFLMGAGSFRFNTRATGSATALPLFFQTSDVTRLQIETNGNIGFNGNIYSNGVGVLHIGNATTTPTVFPTSGGILYVTASGALHWRGPSTDTQIAPA
jgi:hypothetical protein